MYEAYSKLDADEIRRTLEGGGFQVLTEGDMGMRSRGSITLSVPQQDAKDAREFLRQERARAEGAAGEAPADAIAGAVDQVLAVRKDHSPAPCKYCSIQTLDVSEADLSSQQVALLRSAGLGVNTASFSDFEPNERICTECANHDVECDLCARGVDGLLDQGMYRRVNEDEAYICARCVEALDAALESQRDW